MSFPDHAIEIITTRLRLLPASPVWLKEIAVEFTPEITRYMSIDPHGDPNMAEDFINRSQQQLQNGTDLELCILEKETYGFLGCCALHHLNTPAIEIGLWIKKTAHGNGYGTEVVQALMAWATDHFSFEYFYYTVDKENLPSIKIPEKLGFLLAAQYPKKKTEDKYLNMLEYRLERRDR